MCFVLCRAAPGEGWGAHELLLQLDHPKVQGLAEQPRESRAGRCWEVKVIKRFLDLLPCLWALLVRLHCCSFCGCSGSPAAV